MTLKEIMLNSLQCMPLPATGTAQPAAETAKDDKPDFGEILNTVKLDNKNTNVPDASTVRTKTRPKNEPPESKPEVKTYREIQDGLRHEARKPVVRDRQEAAASAGEDKAVKDTDKNVDDGKLDKVINSFAQALGLNPGEFRQLLEAAGIAPEELTAAADTGKLVSKLTDVLGLNADQSKTLGDLLEAIKAQLQASLGAEKQLAAPKPGETSADAAISAKDTADGPEIEVVKVQSSTAGEFSALMAKMKQRLDEIREKLKNNDGYMEGLSSQLSAMTEGKDPASGKEAGMTGTAGVGDAEAAEPEIAAVKTGDAQNPADSGDDKDSNPRENAAKASTDAAIPAASAEKPATAIPINAQVQKAVEAIKVEKTEIRTPVQAKEIINQVLEKAKVILTGDKSEMVMDLKPDSLGKLSLKVVTENGIVMAKFVAESQQVKQVLETNMQLLKDSLEKQGMNVQGFSVSVRQDSQQRGYDRQNGQGFSGRPALRRTAYNNEGPITATVGFAAAESRNPYVSWGMSTVNFTA